MDLNQLLFRHQRALIERGAAISCEARRRAGLTVAAYSEQIARARGALGREDPFTWNHAAIGSAACG